MNVIKANSSRAGKCQYCQQVTNLINAHIIPKSLHASSSGYLSVVDKTGEIGKARNRGLFDKNILCAKCDSKIGNWEKRLKEFLINPNCYNYQGLLVLDKKQYNSL